jgi:septum formation topological specificity factor MinE
MNNTVQISQTWTIDSSQSDILNKVRRSLIASIEGYINIHEDAIEEVRWVLFRR